MRRNWRRWSVVIVGVAMLCSLPAAAGALPASTPSIAANVLRGRVLASTRLGYAGYAESDATFGLPAFPGLGDVTSLLDGVTRMRVWWGSADRWRVDVLSDVGERDTYQLPNASYIWDSGSQLLTRVVGRATVRLPRPADLVPPALAVRLLREAGAGAGIGTLPARRVAGVSAAGLQVTPADSSSTIGRIDVWAQPSNGLPLLVQVVARGATHPALESRFLQVAAGRPAAGPLTPQRGPGTGLTATGTDDLRGALEYLDPVALPTRLAGRPRLPAPTGFGAVGRYGSGLATFAVLALDGQTGLRLLAGARAAGGTPLSSSNATGELLTGPLITAILIHRTGSADTFLLAGLVNRRVLEQAAATLTATSGHDH